MRTGTGRLPVALAGLPLLVVYRSTSSTGTGATEEERKNGTSQPASQPASHQAAQASRQEAGCAVGA